MTVTTEPQDSPGWRELLARAQSADAEAFASLAQACEPRLLQQALALCRNPTLAEDLTAETMVEGWGSIKRFNGKCRFSTWLYAILVHRYHKAIRRARSRPLLLSWFTKASAESASTLLEQVTDTQPAPGEVLLQHELSARMKKAVDSLSHKHQEIILLRFYEGASLLEMAEALNLSLGTVKSRLHHALEKLRRMQAVENLRNDTL